MSKTNYIPDVPYELYINEPDKLIIGQPIWEVGQGGMTKIIEPVYIGDVTHKDTAYGSGFNIVDQPDFFISKIPGKKYATARSYLDKHIIHQCYNNWYLTHDIQKAYEIYAFLKEHWSESNEQTRHTNYRGYAIP